MEAALKLLVENGLHASPMSAIAKAAGTGMGTIYNYFPNKELLINSIYMDIKGKEERIISTLEKGLPIKTQFENYYTSIVDFFLEHPLYFKFMDQFQASPIITEETRLDGLKALKPIVKLVEEGQQGRIIKDIEKDEILQFLGGTIMSYLRKHACSEGAENKISFSNQLRMVWDAIKE